MTVADKPSAWAHTGDGATTTFSYENLVLATSEVKPYLDGVLQTSGFSVTGVGVNTGGNVVFDTAPASGVEIVIRTDVRPTQPTDYVGGDDFPEDAHEKGMDRLCRVVQQALDALKRAPRLALGDVALEMPEIGVTLAELKGKVWFSNASTGAVEGKTLADLPVDVMLSTDTPEAPTTAGAAGSSTTEVSPKDHKHPLPAVTGLATRTADAIGVPKSSQAQAEAGTGDATAMTPLSTAQAIAARAPKGFRNLLINGDGQCDHGESGAGIADDSYGGPDLWYALTQTGTITHSQGVDGEDGMPFYHRINQDQASAQRMGQGHIILGDDCRQYRGRNVVLGGRIRCSASQAIRYAILEWTGTKDSVTSDFVNDWTSGTYTAGNFFLGASVTVVAVGTVTPDAGTWTDLSAITAAVSSSMNNLAVMIWTEGTAAQNVTLDFRLQLEGGSTASAFEHLSLGDTLARVYRLWETSYDYGTAIGAADNNGAHAVVNSSSSNSPGGSIKFAVPKHKVPTMFGYSPTSGTVGKIRNEAVGTDENITFSFPGTGGVIRAYGTTTTADTAFRFHWVADARL